MKKGKWLYLPIVLILLISCTKNEKNHEKKDYQSDDKMISSFKENKGDGYSWRQRKIAYKKGDKAITKEKLLSTIWKMDPNVNQYAVLVFYSDDIFKIGTYQAGVSIQGKYRIDNSKIYLSNYNSDKFMNKYVKLDMPETECVINFDSNNVEFNNELLVSGIKFFPLGSEKNNGDTAIIQDNNVIVDRNIYVFNDTVRFRTKPSVDSDCISISLYNEMSEGKIQTNSFKKGTIVNTLAKTVHTEQIDNRTAPWYYIVVSDGFEGCQYGWVFGAYFDNYIKDKDSYYWEILRTELSLNNNITNDSLKNEMSADQLNQIKRNSVIAESLYKLQEQIMLKADKKTERQNYSTVYYSNGNSAYSTVVQLINNDYLTNSELAIGMGISKLIELLGNPTKSSEKELVYDIFKPNDGYGYKLTFEVSEQKIQKIKCYFEK